MTAVSTRCCASCSKSSWSGTSQTGRPAVILECGVKPGGDRLNARFRNTLDADAGNVAVEVSHFTNHWKIDYARHRPNENKMLAPGYFGNVAGWSATVRITRGIHNNKIIRTAALSVRTSCWRFYTHLLSCVFVAASLVRPLRGESDPIVIGVEPEPCVVACMNEKPNKRIVEVVNSEEVFTNADRDADKSSPCRRIAAESGGSARR